MEGLDPLSIDLILLSHHQHKDNFDHKGRQLAQQVGKIISTRSASRAMPGVIGLADWEQYAVETPKVPGLRITATPARHHPWWLPGFFAGKVIGFVIEYDAQQQGALYISGDTVFFHGIEDVAKRFSIDIGIFHLGSAQFRYLSGFGHYTMDSKDLLKAVKVLQPRRVIPIHYRGWTHFKEKEATLRQVLEASDLTRDRTVLLSPGQRTKIR